jgi:hypothetical protein
MAEYASLCDAIPPYELNPVYGLRALVVSKACEDAIIGFPVADTAFIGDFPDNSPNRFGDIPHKLFTIKQRRQRLVYFQI